MTNFQVILSRYLSAVFYLYHLLSRVRDTSVLSRLPQFTVHTFYDVPRTKNIVLLLTALNHYQVPAHYN